MKKKILVIEKKKVAHLEGATLWNRGSY